MPLPRANEVSRYLEITDEEARKEQDGILFFQSLSSLFSYFYAHQRHSRSGHEQVVGRYGPGVTVTCPRPITVGAVPVVTFVDEYVMLVTVTGVPPGGV